MFHLLKMLAISLGFIFGFGAAAFIIAGPCDPETIVRCLRLFDWVLAVLARKPVPGWHRSPHQGLRDRHGRSCTMGLAQAFCRSYLMDMGKQAKRSKQPYDERSDADKIRSQWTKLTGLHKRNEPSAATVRAATAAELAVNLAIRAEFAVQSQLKPAAIDAMLKKANGLWGKMSGLLLPLVLETEKQAPIRRLCRASEQINLRRNEIVHSGKFSTPTEALRSIESCRTFVMNLVGLYEADFALDRVTAGDLSEDEAAPMADDPPKREAKKKSAGKRKSKRRS